MSFLLRFPRISPLISKSWRNGWRLLSTRPAGDPNEARNDKPKPQSPQHRPQRSLLVNCHNEWDPLEEVIVGTFKDACVPPLELSFKAAWPAVCWDFFAQNGGKPYSKEFRERGEADLEGFCRILEHEGVKVRRPEIFSAERGFAKAFNTPDFESPCTMDAATPRDSMMVIGDTIVEAPMSWRCRFFDYRNYRKLIKEYFKSGAKWLAAPKGMLGPESYNWDWSPETPGQLASDGRNIDFEFAITEFEPLFDTADFIRMGRDIFYQLSNATNEFGIEWLTSHFPDYRFHRVSMRDNQEACHIDYLFVPLAPGKLLIHSKKPVDCGGPEGVKGYFTYDGSKTTYNLPAMFRGWDVFVGPKPQYDLRYSPYQVDDIAIMNVLMLDEKRVCMEAHETEAHKLFAKWGFKPVLVPMRNAMKTGAGFHCFTVDIRRRGKLQSYF